MFRNLSKRIEVVTPVFATGPKQRLWEVLDICLHDQREAWVLDPDGRYKQLRADEGSTGPEGRGTHQTLMDLTRARASL
jgi:polyphosphate kinase